MRTQPLHPTLRAKFGQSVKVSRNEKAITQEELARGVNRACRGTDLSCNQGIISKIEQGKPGVDLPVLRAVGKHLGIEEKLDELLHQKLTFFGICEDPDCLEVDLFLSGDRLVFNPVVHQVSGDGNCYFHHSLRVSCAVEGCEAFYERADQRIVAPCGHEIYPEHVIENSTYANYFMSEVQAAKTGTDPASRFANFESLREKVTRERERRNAELNAFLKKQEGGPG